MPKPFDENENEFIPLNDASQFIPGRPHGATIWRGWLRGIRRQGTGGGTVDWMSSSSAEKQIANTVIFNV